MRKMTLLFALTMSSLLVACATTTSSRISPITKSPKVLEQELKRKEREEAMQDLRDRNRILQKKAQMQGPPILARVTPQNKKIELYGSNGRKARNDRELYGELAASYDRNNEIAFFSRLQAFLESYSKSPLADDALYLAGLMSLSNKNYGPALRYMNEVLKKYPSSNKAAAALFAKGIVLKKMNLASQSKLAFMKVRKSYPGSPEALRAETELKLLKR